MGATNRFSEAMWGLQTTFLKSPAQCTQISRRLQKTNLQLPWGFRTAGSTTAREFGKICKIPKHVARGKVKLVN
jgi:hypothetical protein